MPSRHRHIEMITSAEILERINDEDTTVPGAVRRVIPMIEALIEALVIKLTEGGRLFYIGAGTSGRLGILDASECPPTYGVPQDMVTGVMAGGDSALRYGIENAEDSEIQGWRDLQLYDIKNNDVVIGIAASGTTPYVNGALKYAREHGIVTGCIVCNPGTPVAQHADYPIEVMVGPEFITGSTRMKSGTAQKLILNMISSCVMIRLGRVQDNRMVHMQISNEKLIDRGTKMLMEKSGIQEYDKAKSLLIKHGSVKAALEKI